MAIVHFVKSKRTQTVGGLNAVINYCCKDAKVDYQGRPLISGINCVPQCALQEFMNTKRLHHSTQGRMYYHMVQSFRPDDPVTLEQAHEIALKLAEQIPGFEIVVATHTDRDHIHSHFVINSVSCDTGLKYHSNKESLELLWKASDELCMQYGLSVVKPKKKQKKERTMSDREYRAYAKGDSWKMNLEINIDECMTLARDREHFIRLMEYSGYEVRWEDARKNITYTTPDGHKCRDNKLNGIKYLKEVSTDHDAQLSALENQIDWYKPILDYHPEWELVGQYIDEGITGTSAEKRPEFMRMIEDAKKNKFDMIITREVSRFARNTVDTLNYTRMLREHGVEVYFINDGIKTFDGDGELRLTIMATLAQDESRKTSIRVKSGQQTSMNNGVIYGNGNILGYTRHEWKEGDKKCVEMRIDPEQARTVRLIYDMYLDGCGLVKIKDELERRGYKTAQGKDKWFPTVISHVLKNSFYCGIMTYHKEYTPDYLKQKKVKNYGELEFTQVQGTHEPIVTVEEFERVQRIMDSKKTEMPYLNRGRQKGKKPRTTVWGKLLICECGKTFNMRRWDRADRQPGNAYQCYSSVATGSYESRKKKGLPLDGICQSPMIPEWRLKMMANLIFRKYLSEKEKVLALANSILEAHIGDTEEEENNEALLEAKQAELARHKKKLDNYIEMRAEGDLSRELFRSKCAEVEPRIKQLQEEIETLTAASKPKEVVDYTEKLTVLQYALERYTNIDEGQDVPESVVEAFVVKIVISKDGFDWYLRFDGDPDKPLHCQLQGKRKTNTKILVSSGCFPSMDSSPTGCHQGLIGFS